MKKILASLISIVLILIAILYIIISFLNFDYADQQLGNIGAIKKESLDKTKVKLVKFPFPHLLVEEIAAKDQAVFKDVKIKFSLSSILMLKPHISKITIQDAIIYLDNQDISFLQHDQFISELINRDVLSINTKIAKLRLIKPNKEIAMTLTDLSLWNSGDEKSFEFIINNKIDVAGSFTHNNEDMTLELTQISPNYSLSISENYKNNKLLSGKAQVNIKDLPSRIVSFLPNISNISDKFHNNEEMQINFDITSVEEGLHLQNMVINSKSIIGSGDCLLNTASQGQSKIKLAFDKIDISGLTDNEQENPTLYSQNTNFEVLNHNAEILCDIKSLSLNKHNTLQDVTFKAETADNKMSLKYFAGRFDQQHQFNISGELSRNSFRSIFDGYIDFSHPDLKSVANLFGYQAANISESTPFILKSKIQFTPVYFSLQNLEFKVKKMNVRGNYSTKFIGQQSRINTDLSINQLDLSENSDTPMIRDLAKRIENIFMLGDMKNKNYLNKFIPLRRINSIGTYEISVGNLKYNKHNYNNIALNFEVSPGKIAINRLYLNNQKDWVDFSVELNAQGIIPTFVVQIHDASVNVDFLSAQGILNLRTSLLNIIDFEKANFLASGLISELKDGDKSLSRLVFSLKNDKNLLVIPNLDFDIFGGRIKTSGSILMDPFTINFAYGLNGANIEKITSLLPIKQNDSNGMMSINGVISTNGNNFDSLLYNLYSKSNIVMKGLTINNYSPDEFVSKINQNNYELKNVENDLNKMLLTGSTSITDLKADFKISKGLINASSIIFKTKTTSNSGAANIDIYKQKLDSIFNVNFYLAHKKNNTSSNYKPIDMELKANGDLFNPNKYINAEKVIEAIATR